VKVISQRLGHSTVAITLDTYTSSRLPTRPPRTRSRTWSWATTD